MPPSPPGGDAPAQDAEEDFDPNPPLTEEEDQVYDADTNTAMPYPSQTRGPDPFQGADPWAGSRPTVPTRAPAEPAYVSLRQAPPRRWGRESGASSSSGFPQLGIPQEREHNTGPHKVVFDTPPSWDGKDPDNLLEPYLKLLKVWLTTTRTQNTQRGVVILQHAKGDLYTFLNELTFDQLTQSDSGDLVVDHIKEIYAEYLERDLPKAIEKALYSGECSRKNGENMI